MVNINNAKAADVTTFPQLNSAITTATEIIIKNDITSTSAMNAQGQNSLIMTTDVDGGATLSGANFNGIIVGSGKTLTIEGLTVQNFRRAQGGFINSTNGTTIINNSTIRLNTATQFGGVVYQNGGTLKIGDNNLFFGNTSSSSGGVARLEGSSTLIVGSNNVFTYDASILNSGGVFFINSAAIQTPTIIIGSNNLFENNSSEFSGASICTNDQVYGGSMTIASGNIFKNGTAGNSGGAIFTRVKTEITGSTFTNNKSTNSINPNQGGGALSSRVNGITLTNNTFTSNSSFFNGGAMNTIGNTATLTNNTFTDNSAGSNGGAIAAIRRPDLNLFVSNVVLTSGNIIDGNTAGANGGGIYLEGDGFFSIGPQNIFQNNSATGDGGAIYTIGTAPSIINGNNSFIGNTAGGNGGAIYNAGILTLNSDAGDIDFLDNTAGGANDIFNSGIINITGDANSINIGSGFSGAGDIEKTGSGEVVLGEDSINHSYTGIYNQTAGTLTNYSTSFLGGTNSISDSNLNLFQIADLSINNLALINANVSSLNNLVTTTTVNNSSLSGTNNFRIDIDGDNQTADKFVFNGAPSVGTLNVAAINVAGVPTDLVIPVQIFEGTAVISNPGMDFTQTVSQPVHTPIYDYGFRSDGGGQYSLFRDGFNPEVQRGQVATLAQYQNQLFLNNILFEHVYLDSNDMITKSWPNQYASIATVLAPYQFKGKASSVWYKAYANVEKLSMTNGLFIHSATYGAVLCGDYDVVKLKRGWKYLPSIFLAYNGGRQSYSGVTSYQDGGQGGVLGTFTKGDFIGSLLAYAGGYHNDMNVQGFSDSNNNWFAGTATKLSYNFRPLKNIMVQPNALVSYNIYGKQSWGSDFGALSMEAGYLNGINVSPGLNVIYGRETWSTYLKTLYMFNINDKVNGSAGNVNLPDVRMKYGYIEYGIGATKTWRDDRMHAHFEVVLRNGGRTGVGFQVGLCIKF